MIQTTIGYDATPLIGNRVGIGNYTGRLIAALLEANPQWQYWLYSNRPLGELEPALSNAVQVGGYLSRSRWLWIQLMLPKLIDRSQVDLFHFTNGLAPLWQRKPFILSIYDASLYLYGRYHPRARLLAMRLLLPLAARRAKAIITSSESARKDLLRVLSLPEEQVTVIYGAAPDNYERVNDKVKLEAVKKKYRLPEEFLLYVGTLEPRKNLVRLIRAHRQILSKGYSHELVMVGPWGWSMNGFCRLIDDLGLRNKIHFLGYVPAEDLPGLYSLATVFVFPSLYEGFGLPPLEAMACGTPVLSSNNSSLAEVCADAAYLVDPQDEDGLAEGMMDLLDDSERRFELGWLGSQRAKEFSWERAAEETLTVYRNVLGSSQ